MIDLPAYSESELLENIEEYQRKIICELLKSNDVNKVLDIWISTNGPVNNASFGGSQKKNEFKDNFKVELCKLLSESPEYKKEVDEIKPYMNMGKDILISSITLVLAPKLGTSAVILTPLVVIALIAIAKVGVKAYCDKVLNNKK